MSIQLDAANDKRLGKLLANGFDAARHERLLTMEACAAERPLVSRLARPSTESTAYLIPSLNYFVARKYSVESADSGGGGLNGLRAREPALLSAISDEDGTTSREFSPPPAPAAQQERQAADVELAQPQQQQQQQSQRAPLNASFFSIVKQAFTLDNLSRQISKLRCYHSRPRRARKSPKQAAVPASPLLSGASSRTNSKKSVSQRLIDPPETLVEAAVKKSALVEIKGTAAVDDEDDDDDQGVGGSGGGGAQKLREKLRHNYILIKHRRLVEKFKNDYTISVINGRRLRKSKSFDGLFEADLSAGVAPSFPLTPVPAETKPAKPAPVVGRARHPGRPSIQLRHHSCVTKDMFLQISQMTDPDGEHVELLAKITDVSEVVPIELLGGHATAKKNGLLAGSRLISSFRSRFFSQRRRKKQDAGANKVDERIGGADFFDRLVKYNRLKSINSALFLTHSLTSLSYESIDVGNLRAGASFCQSNVAGGPQRKRSTIRTVETLTSEPRVIVPSNAASAAVVEETKRPRVAESASMLIRDDVSDMPGSVSMSLCRAHLAGDAGSVNSASKPTTSAASRRESGMSKRLLKTFRFSTLRKPSSSTAAASAASQRKCDSAATTPRASVKAKAAGKPNKFYSIYKSRTRGKSGKSGKIKRNVSEILPSYVVGGGNRGESIDLRPFEEKKAELNDKLLNLYLNTSKYSTRRNAICSRIDKIYFNRQLINFMEYLLREEYIKNFLL